MCAMKFHSESFNCYDTNSMSTGNTMHQTWSGPNAGQNWSNHSNVGPVMNNNNHSMLHNNSSMLTNNPHQMPPHLRQSHHPQHQNSSNMIMQHAPSLMNKQPAYPNQTAPQQQMNSTISGAQLNQQYMNNGQTMGRPMYNNVPMSNNMQMMSNQSSMHSSNQNCSPMIDTPNTMSNQAMIYNQQPVNQQQMMSSTVPNQIVVNNANMNNNLNNNNPNNHLIIKQQQQSNYSTQMMPNNPPTQTASAVVTQAVKNNNTNFTPAATTTRRKPRKPKQPKADPASTPNNQISPSANISSDNFKYANNPQQSSMVMQPNMINNNALPVAQQQQSQMMYNNNPHLANRMQGPPTASTNQSTVYHNQQPHQTNYSSNNVVQNGNYMRMNDGHQMTNDGPMMVNGMMPENLQHQQTPMQSSAMINPSNKQPMMPMNSYPNNNLNMSNNNQMQPYSNSHSINGPINSSNGLTRAARSSPYPNPGQYMTQKRAFNAQQQQPNLYHTTANTQTPMINNNSSLNINIPPPVQQQMINNNNYMTNNNTVSPIYNGQMTNQQQQYNPIAQQQSMNAHANNMHYGKQSMQSSINSSYVQPSNNNGLTSTGTGYQQTANNNPHMINRTTNNPMMQQKTQQQRNNTMRPTNQINNNCNTNYPTPPHSNYPNNNNSSYPNDNQNINQSTSNNPMYNTYQQQQQQQHLPMQQQQQMFNNQQAPMTNNSMTNQCTNNSLSTNRGYNNQHNHSPIPSNPTPPLTPYPSAGSANSVSSINNSSTNSQNNQMNVDMKSSMNTVFKEEPRLVIPVKGGMVLEPFALKHELAITNCEFKLNPNVYNQLMTKPDLELQLKSFLKDEPSTMITNWPETIQISVNDQIMQIERGDMKSSQRPLFLKKYCQNSNNKLQFTVSQCCCKHLFVMQVVYCPTVKSTLQNVMHKQIKPVEFCVTKIKQNLNNNLANSPNNSSNNSNSNNMSSLTLTPSTPGSVEEISLEQTPFKLSLKCPISFKRIKIPSRSNECKHLQCFDLESFLILNADKSSWRCPICSRQIVLENLEVDQYILNIINGSNFDFDEILIDSNASWKPSNSINKLKDEQTELNAYQQPSSLNNNQFNNSVNSSKASSNYSMSSNGTQISQNGLQQNNGLNNNSQQQMVNHNSPFDYQSNSIEFNPSSVSQSNQLSELDPLAAIEKTIHDFNSIGRCTPSNNLLSSSSSSNSTELSNNNHSPNSKQSSSMNKSPICSQHQQLSNANTPTSIINNSPHTPHTPHTPLINHNSSLGNNSTSNLGPSVISNHNDINDLNFDPAAVIDGQETGQEALNLLPDDPLELLSYLETTDNNENSTTTNSNLNSSNDAQLTEEIYALFD